MDKELKELKVENLNLKTQLQEYIPRRRVRRVYNQLRKILEEDSSENYKESMEILKNFISKIEKEGDQVAGQDIKRAIEHLLSIRNIEE